MGQSTSHDTTALRARPAPKGPSAGALVMVGGGEIGQDILERFLDLAGGKDAPIVVIPTAGEADDYPPDWEGLKVLTDAGATNVILLHTKDRAVAGSENFVAPLTTAKGVWFPGGRQWRLVDAYLATRTEREIKAVLARGGVVGGTSAGATIQGDYLVRGAREGNELMMAPGYEQGFALFQGVAIDQHVNTRQRERHLGPVIEKHPHLLGVGLDENTAIIVGADRFEVVGAGQVYLHDGADHDGAPYATLSAGEIRRL